MKEGTWIKISKTVTFSPNLYFPLMSVKNICLKTSGSEDIQYMSFLHPGPGFNTKKYK